MRVRKFCAKQTSSVKKTSNKESENASNRRPSLILSNGKNSIGPFYKNDTMEKLFSIFNTENCYICDKELTANYTQCFYCFKSMHIECARKHENSTGTMNIDEHENTEINIDKKFCSLCENYRKFECSKCKKKLEIDKDIVVNCELCFNLIHYDCLNIPLHIIYNRKLYLNNTNIFECEKEKFKFENLVKAFEIEILNSETNKKLSLNNFLNQKLNDFKIDINLFSNLFHICQACLYHFIKIQRCKYYDYKISGGLGYNRIRFEQLPSIHDMYIEAKSLDVINEEENIQPILKMKKIIDFYGLGSDDTSIYPNLGFYLIEWVGTVGTLATTGTLGNPSVSASNNNSTHLFSFESSNFVSKLPGFNDVWGAYIMNKSKEELFYSKYFNSDTPLNYKKSKYIVEYINSFNNENNVCVDSINSSSNIGPSKLLDELKLRNVLLLHSQEDIDNIRTFTISNFINSVVNSDYFGTNLDNSNAPKILICYDDESTLYKWNTLFNDSSQDKNEISLINLDFNLKFKQMLLEMFYFDFKKMKVGIKKFENIMSNSKKCSFNVDEYFRMLENIMVDYNFNKFDVLLLDQDMLLYGWSHIFSKINFDFYLMDFIRTETFLTLSDIIKIISSKILSNSSRVNSNRLLIMKPLSSSSQEFDVNFSNFLYCIYTTNDWLIELPPNWNDNIRMLSKEKKFIPSKLEDTLNFIRKEHCWGVLNYTNMNKNNPRPNEEYYITARKDNFFECDISQAKFILNFIPVNLSKIDFMQYLSILRERKTYVLDKKCENKTDIIKNLNIFCSFPSLMIRYYLNQLSSKNLEIAEFSINENKLNTLILLVKFLFNTSPILTHINIIFNDTTIDHDSRVSQTFKLFKQNVLKHLEKEKKSIHFYLLPDELDQACKYNEEKNIFIFFNIMLSQKVANKLFRAIFNCFKNRNVFFYHLFLKNTIEQNLVQVFYESLDSDRDSSSIIHSMLRDEKEMILKKNITSLNYSLDCGFDEFLRNKKIAVECEGAVYQVKKLNQINNHTELDGICIMDKLCKLFTKGSQFFTNDYEDFNWSFILDEHFQKGSEDSNFSLNNNSPSTGKDITKTRVKRTFQSYNEGRSVETVNKKQKIVDDILIGFPTSISKIVKINNVSDGMIVDDQENINSDLKNSHTEDFKSAMNHKKSLLAGSNLSKEKIDMNSVIYIVLDDEEQENKDYDNSNNINSLDKRINSYKNNIESNKNISENDKNLIESLNPNKLNSNSVKLKKIISSNKNNSNINKKYFTTFPSENIESKYNKFPSDKMAENISNPSLSKLEANLSQKFSYFSNLKLVNIENLRIDQNVCNDIYSYIKYLQNHDMSYENTLIKINCQLISLGMNQDIRIEIRNYILKFGIISDNFYDFTDKLIDNLNIKFPILKFIKKDTIQFYLEYFLNILNKNSNNEFHTNVVFFLDTVDSNKMKKNILYMFKIRELIKDVAKFLTEVKSLLPDLIISLNKSPDLSKIRLNFNSNEKDSLNIFILFIHNLLMCVNEFGFDEYRSYVDSPLILKGILDCKFKPQFYKFITSAEANSENEVDEFLIILSKKIYEFLEENLINKF